MSSKKPHHGRNSLLMGASVIAAATAAMAGAPALAQDAEEEEAIVVTGSRIPQPNLTGTSPVTQVTSEDITTQGVTRIEDLTNQLPQVFATQGSNYSNGASGTAEISLRGLGSKRSLVLVDGHRVGYGSPNNSAADLNQIPGAMVERVEILTGGASAVYGSDAVAGVVNFIMRDNFEGFRIDAQYGFYQHDNDSDNGYLREVIAARGTTNPAEFQLPPDDVNDGFGKEISLIFGASSPDGRGNVTAYATYRSNDAVLQRDRDYSACVLGNASVAAVPGVPAGAAHWTCAGSATSFPGYFTSPTTGAFTISQTTGLFVPFVAANNQYNFGPLNFYQRPDERYTMGAFAHYQINEHAEAYAQAMFMEYTSNAQIAPSGAFFGNTNTINCDNPLLPANTAAVNLVNCTPAEIAAGTAKTFYVGRRNVEGGPRQDHRTNESFRIVAGLRGAVNDSWDYDVSGAISRTRLSRAYLNELSIARQIKAFDVILGPALLPNGNANPLAGVPECRSVFNGSDPACVPYDIFTPGGVTPAALAYLQVPLVNIAEMTQQNVIGTVSGDLGFGSPAAESNIQAAFGVEYRRDELNNTLDASFLTGDGAGQGGPTLGLNGVTDVFEIFGEARMPIVEGAPMADLLAVDVAYRYSEYDFGVQTDTYKIGGEWAPVEDIRFRAAFQKAVRAANIVELFSAQGAGLYNQGPDPCDDVANGAAAVPANCVSATPAPYQVTAAQSTGGTLTNPAGQYNGLFGGNPNLAPEEGETLTYGFVFQPRFLDGLVVTVDYFDIEVTNLIAVVGAANTVNDCYLNGNLASCALITRNPGNGSLFRGAGQVVDLNTNIGGLHTTGIDINANYNFEIGAAGALGFQLVGTWVDTLIVDEGAATGNAPYDCNGLWGGNASCGTPTPEWRHRLRASWETPWNVEAILTWRYYSEATREQGQGVPPPNTLANSLGRDFPAQNYFDIAGNWELFENTRLRFGINNVMDKDPPLSTSTNVGAGAGNGNTFPQVYDALGRWIFVGATVDF